MFTLFRGIHTFGYRRSDTEADTENFTQSPVTADGLAFIGRIGYVFNRVRGIVGNVADFVNSGENGRTTAGSVIFKPFINAGFIIVHRFFHLFHIFLFLLTAVTGITFFR